jgi:hypothetical protein
MAFGAVDAVEWDDLGPVSSDVPNPCSVGTIGGLRVTVSIPNPDAKLVRRNQAVALRQRRAWRGNFAPGRALLTTGDSAGPISLAFSPLILGGGAQIQPDRIGPFVASVAAFDAAGRRLARFTLRGTSTDDADDSAPFIGVRDPQRRIARIELDVPGEPFAIDRFDVAF